MAPANVSSLNPRQGAPQGKPQGNWNNHQRGAAAWDNNINVDSSSTIHGQYNVTALVAMLHGAVMRSLNVTVAAQTNPPQKWVQCFQELDNSI